MHIIIKRQNAANRPSTGFREGEGVGGIRST